MTRSNAAMARAPDRLRGATTVRESLGDGRRPSRRHVLAAATAAVLGATPRPARAGSQASLTGVWSNASYTPLERPPELPRLVLRPEEAEAFEAARRATGGRPASAPGSIGQTESEFLEMGTGLMRVREEIRASLIVDPPDGRIPYTPEARRRLAARSERFDDPEERPSFERCLASSGSGAPIIPSMDANVTAIVQTQDAVVIVSEKLGEARIISMDRPPLVRPVPSWTGASFGRWKGSTLVVETNGLRDSLTDRFFFHLGPESRVYERFTRTGPGEILYEFSVEDPELFSRPWRGEMVFRAEPAGLYEYACHEGNYGLPNILRGARRVEERS